MRIRRSIFTRLIWALSSVTMLCIALVVFVLYQNASRQFEKTFFDHNRNILDNAMQDFENYLEELSDFSLNIRQDEGLLESLITSRYSFNTVAEKLRLLNAGRRNLDVKRVEYYLPDFHRAFVIDDSHLSTKTLDYSGAKWYANIDHNAQMQYVGPGYQEQGVFFSYYRSIIDFQRNNKKAMIVRVDVDPHAINRLITFAQLAEEEMFFFYLNDAMLLYTTAPSFIIQETVPLLLGEDSHFSYGGQAYLRTAVRSTDGTLRMVKIVPRTSFFAQMSPVLIASLGIAAFSILLAFLLTYASVQRITRSVYRLLEGIQKVPDGDITFARSANDEIGVIARRLDEMTRRIRQLLATERGLIRSEQRALQKAMEARVNPHFLYNSLQAISGKAYANGDKAVCDMIEALSSTYRYCISNASNVSICDEVENVKNYIAIGQLRFGERLRMELDVDDMALEAEVPRLCLQILVENAMKYALEANTKGIVIGIRIRRENEYLYITVEDDGKGVPPEKLQALRAQIASTNYLAEDQSSTGLHSLYGRLKMMYPQEVRFDIDSEEGAFFRVDIAIALM